MKARTKRKTADKIKINRKLKPIYNATFSLNVYRGMAVSNLTYMVRRILLLHTALLR